jgi:hypothetical protein
MWAAFEPDESDNFDPATDVVPIESPTYLIINHSKDKDIQIDVDKFITETALATDVGTLQIDLIPEALKTPGTDTIKGIQLLDHGDTIDYSVTDLDLGKITKAVSDMDNGINGTEIENIWKFTIGGEFKVAAGEEWPEQLQLPEYTVEFKFAATDAL